MLLSFEVVLLFFFEKLFNILLNSVSIKGGIELKLYFLLFFFLFLSKFIFD